MRLTRQIFGCLVALAACALASARNPITAPDTVIPITVDGRHCILRLQPHSVRSPDMVVRVYGAGGQFVEIDPGPVRTYRGEVVDSSTGAQIGYAAISVNESNGIDYGRIRFDRGPLKGESVGISNVDGVPRVSSSTSLGNAAQCGVASQARRVSNRPVSDATELYCANLAVDMDVEYFQRFESVQDAQTWVETLVNIANVQYEHQLDITHHIAAIVIRTSEPDPYPDDLPSAQRIATIQAEWETNQDDIDWDIVHLLSDQKFGEAGSANIGGVCKSSGRAFSYSRYFPLNAAQHIFEHELGHNWGAVHCVCPAGTMSTNSQSPQFRRFTPESIADIIAYRDTRECLETCDQINRRFWALPFSDTFSVGEIDLNMWQTASVDVVDGQALLEPGDVLKTVSLTGTPDFGNTLSLSSTSGVDDLLVEYLTTGYLWFPVTITPGEDADRFDAHISGLLGGHDDLQVRFSNIGTSPQSIDNVVIEAAEEPEPCPEDCANNNGQVDTEDLFRILLSEFGQPMGDCDVRPINPDGSVGDGDIDIDDLLAVIYAFGPCDPAD